MVEDADIVDQVLQLVNNDARLASDQLALDVDSSNGVVTLDGSVGRLADKRRIESLATSVDGVTAVNNRLTVVPDVEVSDVELERAVARAILQDRALDTSEVSVAVEGGVVVLRGTVPSLTMKRYAGVLAWWVPGVRDVDNRLDLKWPEEDNDSEITEAVEEALDKDYLVDPSGISVHTYRGVVTLRGAVFSEEQRDVAENDAWFVLGVKDVNNQIRVSPVPPGPVR